ncbi:MAG: HepT-like ribonuclease domain-containing protein [Verrucomicrobiota bacterium]
MSKDNAHLDDVLQAAKAIRRFTEGVSLADFKANEEKYEAVSRKFQIIGEAARRLSPQARNAFAEIPWKLITAMRNIIVHDYDDVDLDVVFDTARENIPPLILRLEAYLAAHPPPELDGPQADV